MKELFKDYTEVIKKYNGDSEFIEEENVTRTANCDFYMELHSEGDYIQIHRRSNQVFMPYLSIDNCRLELFGDSIFITKK